jgi:tRNA (guanine37-N1)-methyltransferase
MAREGARKLIFESLIKYMKFDIVTLFPEMFNGPFSESIISRAQKKELVKINIHNLRDFATDKHKTVDDTPYGGGAGMVLRVDIMDRALSRLKFETNSKNKLSKFKTILLTPTGRMFNQQKAIELSKYDSVILIAGHYEGFDQRIHDHLVDEELSIGEYVLTGGELPAMVIVDAVSRMIPGVIKEESAKNESFMGENTVNSIQNRGNMNDKAKSSKLIANSSSDYPAYTKPAEYKGWKVPEVLLSGNHAEIKKWRLNHTDYSHG